MEPQREETPSTGRRLWHGLLEWVRVIVIALIIAIPIRFFIAEPFVVNGASMDPTFSSGQFLIVDRLTYRFEKPQRGDVIVFKFPHDLNTYYIKRIIGLPGESVSTENGKVTITASVSATSSSSIVLEEPYISPSRASHETFSPRILGPDEYFVMGDNRTQSSDSRVWGALDRKHIIGRPIVRLSPMNAVSFLPGNYNETTETKR